jgi:hypothetical protein
MLWPREKALSEAEHYMNAKSGRLAETGYSLFHPKNLTELTPERIFLGTYLLILFN